MAQLKRKRYQELIEPLYEELVSMARWVDATGARVLVLFEGRDTAGKGGVINAIASHLNPRHCRIVALGKPSDAEAGQWYFQRYVPHLPTRGEIVLFDRSWYNRAGVEKVMGFASGRQVRDFLKQVPVFERLLVDDGILLFKYWLTCDQEEQEKRLRERAADPLKRWKLSPIDHVARTRYREYTRARAAMLEATHNRRSPWTLVDFNDQHRGRLTVIRDLLDRLPDFHVEAPDVVFEPLERKPEREKFAQLKPIASYRDD